MNESKIEARPFAVVLASCWIILIPQFIFALVADTIHVFAISLFLITLALLKRKPLPFSMRWYAYSVVVSLFCLVIFNLTFKIDTGRFFLTPAEYLFPLTAYLTACLILFRFNLPVIIGIVSGSIICLMLAGDFPSHSVFERLSLPQKFGRMDFLTTIYGISIALITPGVIYLLHYARIRHKSDRRANNKLRLFLLTSSLIMAGLLTFLCHKAALYLEQNYEKPFFKSYLNFQFAAKEQFSNKVNLKNTINPNMDRAKKRVYLRIDSKSVPGYIRSQAYSQYKQGKWIAKTTKKALKFQRNNENLTFTTFHLQEPPKIPKEKCAKMTIYFTENFNQNLLIYPSNAQYIETVADRVERTLDGVLTPINLEKNSGLTAYYERSSTNEAAQYSTPPNSSHLSLAAELIAPLKRISQKIIGEANTPTLKATKISQYFNNNYNYFYGIKLTTNKDPILEFLNEHRQGHCELFAASTALLLRAQGIPTRYVTGFYCSEQSGEYFVARGEDMHAWVEAYLEDQKQWVLVESTPAAGRPNNAKENSFGWKFLDAILYRLQKIMSLVFRGYIADAVFEGFNSAWQAILWIIKKPIGFISCFLIILLFIKKIHLKRKKRSKTETETEIQKLLEIPLNTLLKNIQNTYQITHTKSMTLLELQNLIKSQSHKKNELYLDYLTQYQDLRYRQIPNREKILHFSQKISSLTKQENVL